MDGGLYSADLVAVCFDGRGGLIVMVREVADLDSCLWGTSPRTYLIVWVEVFERFDHGGFCFPGVGFSIPGIGGTVKKGGGGGFRSLWCGSGLGPGCRGLHPDCHSCCSSLASPACCFHGTWMLFEPGPGSCLVYLTVCL